MFNLWGIRKNILFLVLIPTILVSLVLSIYFVNGHIQTLETNHLAKGKIAVSYIDLIMEAHTIKDEPHLSLHLAQFRDYEPDILAIAILSNSSDIIIKSGNDSFLEYLRIDYFPEQDEQKIFKDFLRLTSPLSLQGSSEPFYLSIILNRQQLILETYHTIFMASIIAFSILSLSLYIALHLSKTIGTPLQNISEELEAINEGNLDIKLHTPEIPELARISNTINFLASSLKLARENMQQNIEQATADLTQTLETIEIQNIELDLARKQAVQASRVKSEFLANISHEIRTPMNGVIGFTNLLLNSKVDITQKDYLLTIRKSANNLLSIIEDILDFSKIEAGKMTLDELTFSLRDCVEEVITMLSPSSMKKNIELIPLIYKNVPEQLLGDPIRVKQILTNLVSNAIKFTEQGSIVVRVLLEDEDSESQIIRSTISDTGIGMTDEQISKIFQPFSQVNQRINRHHSGTGLGLVISKKLVEQMGGDIQVESKSNEGTSVSFTLRSSKISIHPDQIERQISLPEQSIFIFDPHPMALLAMKQLLSSWDMDIHDFQSIDKLLSAIEQQSKQSNFNPVIMIGFSDQKSHLLDVISKLANIKNQGIFLLGNPTEQYEIDRYIGKGATLHLEKPLTRKQLRKSFAQIGLITEALTDTQTDRQLKYQFSQLRILSVDDNAANLKLLTIVLEEMAIDVIQAYDGLSAVDICKEEHFDLIFMDIRMPGLDGIEASQRIRKEGLNQRTPIIALTAHAMAGEKEQLLASGLEDYLTKPVSTFQLKQLISKWTGQIAKVVDEPEQAMPLEQETSTEQQSINWSRCLEISGGRKPLAQEMLGDLVSAIPEFKQQIENINTQENKLLSDVHKLNGLACYTGVPLLQKIVADLENQLKTDPATDAAEHLQTALINELSMVEAAASTFLEE